jgi:hypothetical protein
MILMYRENEKCNGYYCLQSVKEGSNSSGGTLCHRLHHKE